MLVQVERIDHKIDQLAGFGYGHQAVDVIFIAVVLGAQLPSAKEGFRLYLVGAYRQNTVVAR